MEQMVFTMSAYEIGAADFFQKLQAEKTELVLYVRLHAASQLCGFTKEKDLAFFVPQLTGAAYVHDLIFAPEQAWLDLYRKQHISWEEYSDAYAELLAKRQALELYRRCYAGYGCVCLLGTQTRKRRSHNEWLYRLLRRQ